MAGCLGLALLLLLVFKARIVGGPQQRPLRQYDLHVAPRQAVQEAQQVEEEQEEGEREVVWDPNVGWVKAPPMEPGEVDDEVMPVALVVARVIGQKSIIKRDLPLIQRGYEQAFPGMLFVGEEDGRRADVTLCLSLGTCLGQNDAEEEGDDGTGVVNRLPHLRQVLWSKKSFCESVPHWLALLVSFPCWVLPNSDLQVRDLVSSGANGKWIAKPHSSGGGKGITVVETEHELGELLGSERKLVIQPFLDNPLLVNRRKVDLRVYVLVTNTSPLRAYVHNRGLVRFASQVYQENGQQQQSKSQFLTNTSINKKTSNLTAAELTWSFQRLWEEVGPERARDMRLKMDRSIALILLSVEQTFAKLAQTAAIKSRRYHLLGMDVIFSSVLEDEAKVIEVNGEPSFVASDSQAGDEFAHYDETKVRVARDVASIVLADATADQDDEPETTATYERELVRESQPDTEFRLIYPSAAVHDDKIVERVLQFGDDAVRRQLHHRLVDKEFALFQSVCGSDQCRPSHQGGRDLVFSDLLFEMRADQVV
ncbi:hypothetical protein BASA81_015738 [Batrachochytrium salamandrivorans]|nr:hypothetical protein BASA81_015738 [Batrachochytrium salamandrivorans]